MATIITKNSATAGNTPSNLTQGELAINVADGRLFYGSGSSSVVKQFDTIPTASHAENASNAAAIDIYSFSSPVDSYLLMSNVVATTGVAIGGDSDLRYNSSTNVLTVPNISSTTITASDATISGNVTVLGTASINTLVVNQIGYSSGSNQLGDAANDTQTLYGSVIIPTGSLTVSGSTRISGSTQITGSLEVSSTARFNGDFNLFRTDGIQFLNVSNAGAAIDFNPNNSATPTFRVRGNTSTVLLHIKASEDKVGINTTAPTAMLHVKGSGATSATTALRVENTNASASLVVRDDGSNLFVGSNGTSAGTWIDNTGSLSIIRSTFGTTYGLRVYNGAGWSGHNAIQAIAYQYPIYGAQGSNGVADASPLSAGAGVYGQGGVGVYGKGITPSGDTGSIGVMATSLYVQSAGNTALYNRSASVHILASDSSSNYSFLVQNSAGQTLISAQNNRAVDINSTNTVGGDTTIGTTNGSVVFNRGYNNRLTGNALQFYSGGDASTIQGFYTNPGIAIGYAQTTVNTNPGTALSIRGTTTTSGSGVLFVTGSSTTKLLGIASETNANILVVSGSGFVGIGTNTPTYALDVTSPTGATAARFFGASGTATVAIGANGFLVSQASQYRIYSAGAIPLTLGSYGTYGDLWIINGNVGIGQGTTAPTLSSRFTIKGSGATSATTAFLVQNSTPTTLFQIQDHGSSSFAGNMTVSGSVRISGSAGLTVIGSGSTVLDIQGSQGQLFSITDSLSGSLFSVNDISGLPILEVFSDSTTLIGDYLDPMLITTKKVTTSAVGSFVVYSLPTASYDTAFFDYSIKSGSNARAGQIMAIQSGASVNFTETTTTDFGSTSGVSFTMIVSGSNLVLTGSAATTGWTVKTVIRGI